MNESIILEKCQQAIGYHFRQADLLRSALTHTSSANTRQASNERMEFLGDAVLGLVCCEQLYLRYPEYHEGEMTKVKSAVVSRKICAKISSQLQLGDYLFLGKGMNSRRSLPENVLADVFESLVAAIYLDGGLEPAKNFVLTFLIPEIECAVEGGYGNYKSMLQQLAQKLYGDTPRYCVLDEQGPDHNKCFKISAEIADQRFPPAWGNNKKDAEQKAAMNALAALRNEPIPFATDY